MRFKLSFFLLLFWGIACIASAQDISNFNMKDIKNVNVDNLSQQQIERIYKAIQSRGLTIDEALNLAKQRGMSTTQAEKLHSRLNRVASSSQTQNQSLQSLDRLRRMPPGTTKTKLRGVSSVRDSLLSVHSIQKMRYEAKQDSIKLARKELKNKIFGYKLFNQNTTSFEPVMNIPTPENYQLGPGDQLIIDIYGASERTYNLKVSPDGMVLIDKIGPVYVNGLTIEEARKRLKSRLGQIYSGLNPKKEAQKNTYMQLSLGQVRSINVTVIGEAAHPGTYTLSSLATVFNALYSAGGPTVKGSFRDIDIIRGDSVIETFDLYDLLINGDRSKNIRLKSQDIIKINPYINRVQITGEVKRPGIYEMRSSGTLTDLIKYAGKFRGDAYTKQIKVIGSTDRQRRINDVSKKDFDHFKLRNGDLVKVSKVLDRFKNLVEIHGAVFRPGKFNLTDTTTVRSLIRQAGGLRGDAFRNRAIIYREQKNYTLETLRFNVGNIMQNPAKYDIPLKKNDLVVISSIFDMRGKHNVQIKGPVQDPGRYHYNKGMTLGDLILEANGFTKEATPDRIEVARRVTNEKGNITSAQIAHIYHFNVDKDLKLNSKNANFKLQLGDIVYVRQAPNYKLQQQVQVTGQVRYPGTYAMQTKNDRISDIVKRAGGLTNDAYAAGATLYRKLSGHEIQGNKNEYALTGFSTRKADSGESVRQQQRNKKVTISKVGIHLPKILDDPGSKYDLFVQRGDSIVVPKKLQTVFVKGGVFYPTSIRYNKHMNYKDYITAAGGYNDKAKKNKSYIVYANGDVNRVKRFLFFKNYPNVKPGATLVVPEQSHVNKISPQERVAILSAIVSTIAVISTTIFQIAK